MIFHVTSNRKGEPVDFLVAVESSPVGRTTYGGGRIGGCACKTVFAIVPDSIGDDALEQGAKKKRGQSFICLCNGELIP